MALQPNDQNLPLRRNVPAVIPANFARRGGLGGLPPSILDAKNLFLRINMEDYEFNENNGYIYPVSKILEKIEKEIYTFKFFIGDPASTIMLTTEEFIDVFDVFLSDATLTKIEIYLEKDWQ